MAYDQKMAGRIKEILTASDRAIEEKRMFGGLCFMVNQKMCIGVEQHRIMVRLDPGKTEELLNETGVHSMDFTGKPMKGYVFVDTEILKSRKQFEYWVGLALAFNNIAKSSKKKK